jgi:STE24 endopeptidase
MRQSGLPLRPPRSTAARVGLAAVATVVVAEVAVYWLGPGGSPLEPVAVSEHEFFDDAQLERARSYRDGQRWLMLAGLGVQGAVLLALALGRPAPARRALARLGTRPLLGAAAAGAGIAVVVAIVALPTRLLTYERAVDIGLVTQSLGAWLWDFGRSGAITVGFAAAGSVALVALLRRWPRRWWVPGTAAVVAIAVTFTWIAPVALGPIFHRFDPLPEASPLRADVIELAERAGVDVGEVYSVDASRRVTRESAYVDGLGPTKRVVLYDNLIDRAPPREVRAVVAHELAHVANNDIPRGLAFVAIVAPFGLLFVRELGRALARRAGAEPGSVVALPAYLLALAVASTAIGVAGNQLSRQVEARADAFAVELTGDPATMIDLQLRLAEANVADPDPPGAVTFLLRTHPPTVERIGIARAYEEQQRRSGGTVD